MKCKVRWRLLVSILVSVFLGGAPVWADPPVLTVPAKLDAKPGRMARLAVKADNTVNVKWWVESTEADLFREYDPTAISLCFVADQPGTYTVRIIASGNKGELSEPVACVITVGTPVPPVPPTPPTPPVPPIPTDPLTQSLQAAYTTEADPQKAAKKDLLHSLYQVASQTTVNDPSLATTADLLAKMQAARKALLADQDLLATRQAVEGYLNSKLPKDPASLDLATRQLVGAEFQKVATALGNIK